VEAFWAATYLWDLANYAVPSVAIVAAFAAFGLPYYTGRNLPAVAALFALFGLSSLPLTYVLHFFFLDEMAALTWMLAGFFTWAFLSVTTNLMLQVRALTHSPTPYPYPCTPTSCFRYDSLPAWSTVSGALPVASTLA
jgi:hypothetical protein